MKKKQWRWTGWLGLILLVMGCVEASEEHEDRRLAFYEVAGNQLFTVDQSGTRTPLEFLSLTPTTGLYLDAVLGPDLNSLFTVTSDYKLTGIDLGRKAEALVMILHPPEVDHYISCRLGWAGNRLYLMLDTVYQGTVILEANILAQRDSVLAARLAPPAAGLGPAVSFDLAAGGNQVWVAYQSGAVRSYNLYLADNVEGRVAKLQKTVSDFQSESDGSVFLTAADGIYALNSLGQVNHLVTMDGLSLTAFRDLSRQEIYAVRNQRELWKIALSIGSSSLLFQDPSPVQRVISPESAWLKNTRPMIQKPIGVPPYKILQPNLFFYFFFLDPEGEPADVTVSLIADPAQNMEFFIIDGATVLKGHTVQKTDVSPETNIDLSFYGGTQPGPVTFQIEVVSSDGQVSRSEYVIQTE